MGWFRLEPRRQGTTGKSDGTPDSDNSWDPSAPDFGVEREARNPEYEGGLVHGEDFVLSV